MPELPEVETTRAGIEPHVQGQRVRRVVVREPRLRWPVSEALTHDLPGQTLHAVQRRAKYLLFAADTGHVCLHLGMSGRLRVVPADTPVVAHDHLDIELDNGWLVRFNDARRFGSVFWLTGDPHTFSLLARLGPEPLSPDFDGAWLKTRAAGRRMPVKTFIMDGAVVVGVGNIYASEALHAAGIHPRRAAQRIGLQRYIYLAEAIKRVLAEAITVGGTTLRDYIGVDGDTGYFQLSLAAYGRDGAPCPRGCGPIRREVIGQRATFFCPVCQR
ncbi:bifunctional DNA-formamidopyrimidine glycosylase/DNA-(apurinic or apyrimidinic site) lyase [Salinisphaera sp. Q1T1-3]|uniref:bifunctional DNA-formamidopyrimidine glycosylase/DNA-(apurinic or apyrimidinic site) lyase n=1 Tax=Salinisphaera sp. Q1T1-3 TaxID=2321229 RepID=UPI000E72DC3B|nr:bifunctional DNA-formamidopyrimidine glycosylase/DNA-(apurinic or apyrimidinic site) lyase [Salinisphaera sp. Q1T1-3]RJS93985.1 bifunctional DNA-formamidopyrimidine glycosylase/DNA-(apurinic or apyrimidinic site) lyase [Salinisphaera sp. Q1T1-3]